MLRLDGGLFFATAEALENRVRELADAGRRCTALVLDLEGVDFVDAQGSAKLHEIHELLEAEDIELRLAQVRPTVHDVLAADGLIELLGADHIHADVYRAVQAQLESRPGSHGIGG